MRRMLPHFFFTFRFVATGFQTIPLLFNVCGYFCTKLLGQEKSDINVIDLEPTGK
jgi:hypothetical protein